MNRAMAKAYDRVVTVAKELAAFARCRCHECWTGRGRHDPHGCLWADIEDLRLAVEALDSVSDDKTSETPPSIEVRNTTSTRASGGHAGTANAAAPSPGVVPESRGAISKHIPWECDRCHQINVETAEICESANCTRPRPTRVEIRTSEAPMCQSCEARPVSKWCNGCIVEDHQAAEIAKRASEAQVDFDIRHYRKLVDLPPGPMRNAVEWDVALSDALDEVQRLHGLPPAIRFVLQKYEISNVGHHDPTLADALEALRSVAVRTGAIRGMAHENRTNEAKTSPLDFKVGDRVFTKRLSGTVFGSVVGEHGNWPMIRWEHEEDSCVAPWMLELIPPEPCPDNPWKDAFLKLSKSMRELQSRCTSECVTIDQSDQMRWRWKERHAWSMIEDTIKKALAECSETAKAEGDKR